MDNLTSSTSSTDQQYAAKLARAAAARPRDVWSDDPDRTTRRGDTSQLVAREADQLTRAELDELDPISPARPCLCCGAIR